MQRLCIFGLYGAIQMLFYYYLLFIINWRTVMNPWYTFPCQILLHRWPLLKFPKCLRWTVSPLSHLTTGKIWLVWVQWPLCGRPGNDGKCWIFIGWVTMRQRISAVSGSKVTEYWSPCRGRCRLTLAFWFVDVKFLFGFMRCRVRKSRKSGQKFKQAGAKFVEDEFSQNFYGG